MEERGSVLGYSTCGQGADDMLAVFDLGSSLFGGGFGTSGSFRILPPPEDGVDHALEQVRRATDNLARSGWLDDEPLFTDGPVDGPLSDIDAVNRRLQEREPEIVTVVLTEPTPALAEIVADSEPNTADLLELAFDRGEPEP